jgi:pyrrolysine biosynthesis protein PylC
MLGGLFMGNPELVGKETTSLRGVVYEHLRVSSNRLEIAGEHIMSGIGPLCVYQDFFGADEAITDYVPGRNVWVATVIVSGSDRQDAWARREQVVSEIRSRLGLDVYVDPVPDD